MSSVLRLIVILLMFVGPISDAWSEEQAPSVAILYFNYDGQDTQLQVLKKGLAQMLISHVQPGVPSVKV